MVHLVLHQVLTRIIIDKPLNILSLIASQAHQLVLKLVILH